MYTRTSEMSLDENIKRAPPIHEHADCPTCLTEMRLTEDLSPRIVSPEKYHRVSLGAGEKRVPGSRLSKF